MIKALVLGVGYRLCGAVGDMDSLARCCAERMAWAIEEGLQKRLLLKGRGRS